MANQDVSDESGVDVEVDLTFDIDDVKHSDDSAQCPECEITYNQFSKNNRFGCSNDYQVFEEQIEALFAELHGAVQHIGRSPGKEDQHAQVLANRIRLEKRLQDVVAQERFEEAAAIRDQLKDLD